MPWHFYVKINHLTSRRVDCQYTKLRSQTLSNLLGLRSLWLNSVVLAIAKLLGEKVKVLRSPQLHQLETPNKP